LEAGYPAKDGSLVYPAFIQNAWLVIDFCSQGEIRDGYDSLAVENKANPIVTVHRKERGCTEFP
jgi:hypothetical protein